MLTNCYKYNVNALSIVASVEQIYVLLLKLSDFFTPDISDPYLVEFTNVESEDREG